MSISPERASRRCTTTSLAGLDQACRARGGWRGARCGPGRRTCGRRGGPGLRAARSGRPPPRLRLPRPPRRAGSLAGTDRAACPRLPRPLRSGRALRSAPVVPYLTWLSFPEQARCHAPSAGHRDMASRRGDPLSGRLMLTRACPPPVPRVPGGNYHAPGPAASAGRMAWRHTVINSLRIHGERPACQVRGPACNGRFIPALSHMLTISRFWHRSTARRSAARRECHWPHFTGRCPLCSRKTAGGGLS